MLKLKSPKSESSITLVLLAIAVTIIIVGLIVASLTHHTKKKHQAPNNNSTHINASNPYAGWKQYCDAQSNLCFKYPPNWKMANMSPVGTTFIKLRNPGTIEVDYDDPYTGGSIAPAAFYVHAAHVLAGDKSLAIIGGYFTSKTSKTVQPFYEITDESYLHGNPLKPGQIGQLASTHFTNPAQSTYGTMTVSATANNGSMSTRSANIWLSSSDARAGVLVLESLKPAK